MTRADLLTLAERTEGEPRPCMVPPYMVHVSEPSMPPISCFDSTRPRPGSGAGSTAPKESRGRPRWPLPTGRGPR
jgi:hypothetical protein